VIGARDYNHNFWDVPTGYGDVYFEGALSVGVYATGLFSGSNPIRVTGRMLIESLGYSESLAFLMKFVIGRTRPYAAPGQYQFNAFQTNEDHQSFPSGHTIAAFSTSTILAEEIGTWWSRVLFYGAAGLTGFARIHNDRHWFSDVVFGSALGFGTGWFVIHNEKERESGKNKVNTGGRQFSLSPSLNGFNLSYAF